MCFSHSTFTRLAISWYAMPSTIVQLSHTFQVVMLPPLHHTEGIDTTVSCYPRCQDNFKLAGDLVADPINNTLLGRTLINLFWAVIKSAKYSMKHTNPSCLHLIQYRLTPTYAMHRSGGGSEHIEERIVPSWI